MCKKELPYLLFYKSGLVFLRWELLWWEFTCTFYKWYSKWCPTRQIFRPVENSHVFFFCMCAGIARPSFMWCSPYSRFAVDVVENLLRIVLGSPALEQFSSGSSGALPPSDDSLVGPLARHLAGSRLQSCLLTENCCRP